MKESSKSTAKFLHTVMSNDGAYAARTVYICVYVGRETISFLHDRIDIYDFF